MLDLHIHAHNIQKDVQLLIITYFRSWSRFDEGCSHPYKCIHSLPVVNSYKCGDMDSTHCSDLKRKEKIHCRLFKLFVKVEIARFLVVFNSYSLSCTSINYYWRGILTNLKDQEIFPIFYFRFCILFISVFLFLMGLILK